MGRQMVTDSMAGVRQDTEFQYHGKGAAALSCGCSNMGPVLGGKSGKDQMRQHVGCGHGQLRFMQGTRRNASEKVPGLPGGQVVLTGEGYAHPGSGECGGGCVVTQ